MRTLNKNGLSLPEYQALLASLDDLTLKEQYELLAYLKKAILTIKDQK